MQEKSDTLNTIIYYFSGTGNSLAIAKKLAGKLQCPCLPVMELKQENEHDSIKKLVIVFPVYLAQAYGLPVIVKEKLECLKESRSRTVIGVCTCGGFRLVNAVPALCTLRKVVKANGLGAFDGYSLKLPMNNLEYPSVLINQDQKKMFLESEAAIKNICKNLLNDKHSLPFFFQMLFTWFMKPLYYLLSGIYTQHVFKMAKLSENKGSTYLQAVGFTDRSIEVSQNCNRCGLCVKVCPAHNIELKNDGIIFLNKCEMCMACDEWCPSNAIHHWCRTEKRKYHHPEVSLGDVMQKHSSNAST